MLGAITQRDIENELVARGITAHVPTPVDTPSLPSPPPSIPTPPIDPTQPITVLPPAPIDYYEPYIPIYPPAVVTPEDIAPYPGEPVEEKKGLSKGLLAVIGITAFALMVLAKPKPTTRAGYTPRRY